MHWKAKVRQNQNKREYDRNSKPYLFVSLVTGALFTSNLRVINNGQIVNQLCYLDMLTRLQNAVRQERHELWPNNWFLQQDNAPSHDALTILFF